MKFISYISQFMIPFLLFYVVGYGLFSKRDIYSDFLEGAKEGLKTVKGLVPVLIGLMTAVGVLRASGFLDFLGNLLEKITTAAGIPPQIVPLGLVRLFSSSAATGLLLDIFKESGADSPVGLMDGEVMLAACHSECRAVVLVRLHEFKFGSVGSGNDKITLVPALLHYRPDNSYME